MPTDKGGDGYGYDLAINPQKNVMLSSSFAGRANYMREILSGKVDAREFAGQALHDALDLCLECKGCKAECPSNVDMAKLKYEFLAHYNEANGTPLRSRIFAGIHSLSRMASNWPAV